MDWKIIFPTCVMLLCCISVAQSASWNKQILFHHAVKLSCNSSGGLPDETSIDISWIIPTGKLLKIRKETMIYQGYIFNNYGRLLEINDTKREHFGVYYCMVDFANGTTLNFKHGINVDGAYFGDPLVKYRPSMITAGIAAGIMFCFATILCFTCSMQQERGQRKLEKFRENNPGLKWAPASLPQTTEIYDNVALELEERKIPIKEINGQSSRQTDTYKEIRTKL